MVLAATLSACIAVSGMLWPHDRAGEIVAAVAGLLGWTFSTMAIVRGHHRRKLALVGVALTLATVASHAGPGAIATQVVGGILLVILGLTEPPSLERTSPAPAH